MRRTKADAAITRDTLLKTALVVFSQKGFTATTLEDVAKRAGVTRGAIYWHFGSKIEMYNALLDQYASRGSDIVRQATAEGGSLPEILTRVFVRLLCAVEEDPNLRSMMELSLFKTERSADLAASQQQQIENTRALLGALAWAIRKGIAAGDLRSDLDPVEIARAFLAFQDGAVRLWLLDPTAFSLKDSAPALAEIFLHGALSSSA